jgi:hypothetical protein
MSKRQRLRNIEAVPPDLDDSGVTDGLRNRPGPSPGHRHKLAAGASGEPFDDDTMQKALALPDLADVVTEIPKIVGKA